MKVTIAQLNPVVGDIAGNLKKIKETLAGCSKHSPDLVVFPELFLVGYPPRDLLERSSFIDNVKQAIHNLVKHSTKYPHTGILVGAPISTGKNIGRGLYNSALLIYQGNLVSKHHKSLLPSYDVFDETRYFDSVSETHVIPFKEEKLGISICEDSWNDPELWPKRYYPYDPQEILARKGATIFINISASPFHIGKEEIRFRILHNHSQKHGIPFIYVNQVGGNDELIFDGRSMCLDKHGKSIEILPSFQEHVQTIDTNRPGILDVYTPQEKVASIYNALILGLRDYTRKCGFSKVIIGLSGGIDSAVACYLASQAIGSENVLGVTMPGPYSSPGSVNDSRKLAENLDVRLQVIPISQIYNSYLTSLEEHLDVGGDVDVTMENIQARIRGNILMALSNKLGYLVLSCGNKSEIAVGYCTLYGDMTGGLTVLSDVPKTMVYELACYINRKSEIIPKAILEKTPSAELKPDQTDQDALPPYDILDEILKYYVDEGYSSQDILDLNFDPDIVEWVTKAVNQNEYKRRQAAPGLKVTPKAFGVGRRMPIAARYDI
ncbi:MAG: NAD+ synthase [Petrotogales bacterium]